MSYDVELLNSEGKTIILPYTHRHGGTYRADGTDEAKLNITFNYVRFYIDYLPPKRGLLWLHRKRAKKTTNRLFKAVKGLGCEQFTGTWHNINLGLALDHHLFNRPFSPEQEAFLNEHHDLLLAEDFESWDEGLLKQAIKLKIVNESAGYWKPTPGNAGFALNLLLHWGLLYPDGRWSVS